MDTERRYRIRRRIAAGGMAEVLEASLVGDRGFERRVAIKRILAELDDEAEFLDRFADEARIASQLHHPNIVDVIEFGLMDGRPILVMELVEGTDLNGLEELTASTGLGVPPEIALHITSEIAHALAYAHEARGPDGKRLGLVHRDVSPGNVLVGWEGTVKLADFGIALAHGRSGRTAVGVVRGKLEFMAPEQFRRENVDGRADIFALGCVLHKMLTGESPLRDPSARDAVFSGRDAPVSQPLDDDLRQIIERATRFEPKERYPNAIELADDCWVALTARTQRDVKSVFRGFLERASGEPTFADAQKRRHQLMDLELVLRPSSGPLSRFESVSADPTDRRGVSTQVAAPVTLLTFSEQTGETPRTTVGEFQPLEETLLRTEAQELSITQPKPMLRSSKAPEPPEPRLGSTVGGYELVERLGEGPWGWVYRARHGLLGHEVTLKLFRHGLPAEPGEADRVLKTAQSMARMNHLQLARVLDLGLSDDQRLFLTTERFEGKTLEQRLRERGRLLPREVAELLAQLGRGLALLHEAGIVHGNLKPSNVLLVPTPAGVVVKLIDLSFPQAHREGALLRAAAPPLGMVQYASPERLRGEGKLGPSSDLYSLGALVYTMLSGHPPFSGTPQEVREQHLTAPPAALGEHNGLGPLALQLLAKSPEERPASATAVLESLRLLGHETTQMTPSLTRPHAAIGGAPAASPRSTSTALLVGASLLLAASTLALVFTLSRRPPAPAPVVPEPRPTAVVQPSRSAEAEADLVVDREADTGPTDTTRRPGQGAPSKRAPEAETKRPPAKRPTERPSETPEPAPPPTVEVGSINVRMRALRAAIASCPPDQLAALEDRYLALRVRLDSEFSNAELQRIEQELVQLEREVRRAAKPSEN